MAINKNINDDITLAYLLKKVKTDVLSVLNAAVEKIYVALGNKVDKAGDTMTGMLHQKSTNLDIAQTQSVWGSAYHSLTDKNDNRVGVVRAYQNNGFDGIQISGHNGSTENALRLGTKSDGSRNVSVTDPAAWRTALNAVNKSGDTMTGGLNIETPYKPMLCMYNKAADISLATDTASRYWSFYQLDKNGKIIGYLESNFNTDGLAKTTLSVRRIVNGSNTDNYIVLNVAADGTRTISVSSPAAWRSALGLGTNGAFPITIAQGGTGQTGVTSTTNASQIATAGTNMEISSASFSSWGKVGAITLGLKANAAIAYGAKIATLVSGKRPVRSTWVLDSEGGSSEIQQPTGAIVVKHAIASGRTIWIETTYLLA